MPGDVYVHHASYSATLAATVDARPEDVWPWLVQMGYRRGGLYSYDWLDRLFGYLDRPSAVAILPEFQRLNVGDEIPMGRGSGFPVQAITPRQSLVLAGAGVDFAWVWQFGLYPIDGGRTRLISRNAVRVPTTVGTWLFMRAIEPAAFVMTRKMLLGIKRRAEGGSRVRRSSIAALWLFLLLVTTGGVVLAQQTGRGNPPLVHLATVAMARGTVRWPRRSRRCRLTSRRSPSETAACFPAIVSRQRSPTGWARIRSRLTGLPRCPSGAPYFAAWIPPTRGCRCESPT
jgi:hypothetical protein